MVVEVHGAFGDVVGEIVGLAEFHASFHAAAGPSTYKNCAGGVAAVDFVRQFAWL